jgi:hypothetical protein
MRNLHFAFPALALLAGCGVLTAEIEIPSVVMTSTGYPFPEVPAGGTLRKDIPFDLGDKISLITEKNVSFDLRLLAMDVTLVANPAMGDFSDIQSVTLSVLAPAGSPLEPALLAAYTKPAPPGDQHPTSIPAAGRYNLDLSPYLTAGVITLRLEATSISGGLIPAWTGDVSVEFYLKVRADYGAML